MDEIDILSEGAMEREIMMEHIRMANLDQMQEYKKFNLQSDNMGVLNINDSNELEEISSDSGEDQPDEEEV